MTERGLPIVDGAPACPFVALADDRDERSTSPDHRHRCYAESPPAPRALAHQEAYCLSSAFPVCPTFQDWARREAARTREPEPPDADDEAEPIVIDPPPRRRGTGWNAPPPWLRRGAAGGGADAAAGRAADAAGASPYAEDDPAAAADAGIAAGAAAAGIVGVAGAMGAAASSASGSGGLSGSFADRLLSGADDAPSDSETDAESPARASHPARGHERLDHSDRSGHEESIRERDLAAPSWERPRRLEAYPTLRDRRLGGVGLSSLVIALIAILLAAALLFFLPSFLGLGSGPASTGSPAASFAAASEPEASNLASNIPAATPFTYEVENGDTMTKIANKFHVPLQALIDANKTTIPNPDVLTVGEPVIIPTTTPTSLPGESASP